MKNKKYLSLIVLLIVGLYSVTNFTGFGSSKVIYFSDSLRFGDTTSYINFGQGVKDFIFTMQDSSDGSEKIDSLKLFYRAGEGGTQSTIGILYAPLAVHELSQTTSTTDVSLLVATSGTSKSYKFHSEVPVFGVYVARLNVGGVTGSVGYPVKTPIRIEIED